MEPQSIPTPPPRTPDRAAYWRAVATALQGIITQTAVVQREHRAPVYVSEYIGSGIGAPRFMATTSSEPGHGWRIVASVGTDGTVRPVESAPSGYICKRCGGPAPAGVGYTDSTPGAAQESQSVRACPCGYSQAHVAAIAEQSSLSYAETVDVLDGFKAALDRARAEQPQIDL